MTTPDSTQTLGSYLIYQTCSVNVPKSPLDPLQSIFESDDDPNEEDITEFDSSQIVISPAYPPVLDKYHYGPAMVPTPLPPTPARKVSLPGLRTSVASRHDCVPIVIRYLSTVSHRKVHGARPTTHIVVTLAEAPPTLLKVGIEVEGRMTGRLTKIYGINGRKVLFVCERRRYPYGIVEADCKDVKLPWQWKMKQAHHRFMIFVKRTFRAAVARIL